MEYVDRRKFELPLAADDRSALVDGLIELRFYLLYLRI